MTTKSRYSYTTSWTVGRRFRRDRRIAPVSRRCAGANLVISVRNWASADRRATADWVLPGTSTSAWTERRPEIFFALMMAPWDWISAAEGAPRPPGDARCCRERIAMTWNVEHEEMVELTTFVVNLESR